MSKRSKGGMYEAARVEPTVYEPLKPHIGQILATAFGQAFEQPAPTFFPGQTYAPTSAQTERAMELAEQRALSGSPVTRAAQDFTGGILSGDQDVINRVLGARLENVIPGLQSQFAKGGMLRSSLAREAEQKAVSNEAAKLAMQAAAMAPQLASEDWRDIARLSQVGAEREDIAQQAIDEAIARHQFPDQEKWDRLANYRAMVLGGGMPGTGQVTYEPRGRPNRLGQALGGGLGGAQLGGMLGGAFQGGTSGSTFGPLGTLVGGGLGALGGLLF